MRKPARCRTRTESHRPQLSPLPPRVREALRPHGTRILLYRHPDKPLPFVTFPAFETPLPTPMRCMDCDAHAVGLVVMGHLALQIAIDGAGEPHRVLSRHLPTLPGGYLCLACMAERAGQPQFGWWQTCAEK